MKRLLYPILILTFLIGCDDFLDKRDPTATSFVEFSMMRIFGSSIQQLSDVFTNPTSRPIIFYMDEAKSDNAYSRLAMTGIRISPTGTSTVTLTIFSIIMSYT